MGGDRGGGVAGGAQGGGWGSNANNPGVSNADNTKSGVQGGGWGTGQVGGTNGWGQTDVNNSAPEAAAAEGASLDGGRPSAQSEADNATDRENARAFDRAEKAMAFGLSGRTEGGIRDGGPLGDLFSGLNTALSVVVPGYTPFGMLVSGINTGIGALNSADVTSTGSYGPSYGDAATAIGDAVGDAVGGASLASTMGVPGTPGADPTGMMGNLHVPGAGQDALTQALVQQRTGGAPPATPAVPSAPWSGVPDPRSLAGLMARHNPMTPVFRG
jgi:hypothetical protein